MQKQHRNVLVLSGCQATLQTTGVTMIAVTGLAGYALAADKSLATVPLTCYVVGSAITTVPASFLMDRIGRRGGFQVGTAVGMGGAAICALAIYYAQFWLLCLLLGGGLFGVAVLVLIGAAIRHLAMWRLAVGLKDQEAYEAAQDAWQMESRIEVLELLCERATAAS